MTIEQFIEFIESKRFQASTEFQCGYQLALNDILYEAKKLSTSGSIKISDCVGFANFKKANWDEPLKSADEQLEAPF
jgi:hypothetical protein